MSHVRSCLCAIVLCLVVTPAAFAQFPYEGVVTLDSGSLYVRSGPSENHYRTGVLKRDDRVTVVGEKPGGWLAIKPPEGSFNWVAGDHAKELSATEIELTGDNVLVRIGTPVDPRQRDSWQLKLNRGARLQYLERTTSGQGQLTKVWYKVVPPAGDVRYVNGQFVHPADGRRPTTRSDSRPDKTATPMNKPRPTRAVDEESDAAPIGRRPPGDAEGDSVEPQSSKRVPADNSPRSRLERAQTAYRDMQKKPLIDRDINGVRTMFEQAAKSAKDEREHAIIAQRLEDLETQGERKTKLEELDRLVRKSKQRDDAILSVNRKKPEPPREAEDSEDPPASAESSAPAPSAGAQDPLPFDGSGILRRSSVTIDGKPAYVLASPYGGIRYYVTPAPGLDLKKFLDQTVAVRGPVNFRTEIRAQHITVRDVTPVDVKR